MSGKNHKAWKYLQIVQDSVSDGPKNETLEQHREHCEAEEGNCPFENEADKTDDLTKKAKSDKTPEQLDSEYMDAVKRGDMETAQRMVRDAASRAMPNTKVVDEDGLPKVLYHGGGLHDCRYERPFTINESVPFRDYGVANHVMGTTFWMTDSIREGEGYNDKDDKLMYVFVNSERPAVYDVHGNPYFAIYGTDKIEHDEDGEPINRYTEELVWKHSKSQDGTDCVIVNNVTGGEGFLNNFYIAYLQNGKRFNSNIKSADPVTYDDAGNIIPLSHRFDMKNTDIRY